MQTASDDYENNKTNTLYAYQAAKIDRDAQKESTTASFRKLYTDLQEKQTALAAAGAGSRTAEKDVCGKPGAVHARHDLQDGVHGCA